MEKLHGTLRGEGTLTGELTTARASVSISVDSDVTTGAPGTPARVDNLGTNRDAVLKFTIPQGPRGEKGETGETGSPGQDGAQGPAGETGPAGKDGKDGSDGTTFTPSVSAAGVISWTNDGGKQNPTSRNIKGPQGDTGPTGETGPQGPAGQDGQNGQDGADGTTFTPSVSAAGVISWTNDGGKTNPEPVDIKGPQGDPGEDAELVILKYGVSTWSDFIDAYRNNLVIYCRASSNSDPATGTQGRLAFMAYVNNETNPTEVEFQYYRSVNAHSDAQQGDQVFVYKLTSSGTWTVTTRNTFSKINVGSGLSKSYSNGVLTINLDLQTWTGGSY